MTFYQDDQLWVGVFDGHGEVSPASRGPAIPPSSPFTLPRPRQPRPRQPWSAALTILTARDPFGPPPRSGGRGVGGVGDPGGGFGKPRSAGATSRDRPPPRGSEFVGPPAELENTAPWLADLAVPDCMWLPPFAVPLVARRIGSERAGVHGRTELTLVPLPPPHFFAPNLGLLPALTDRDHKTSGRAEELERS